MQLAQPSRLSRSQQIWFVSSAALLVLAGYVAVEFVPGSLLRLAVVGAVGAVGALIILAYPRLGMYAGVFYIYANLAAMMPLPLSYPLIMLTIIGTMIRLGGGEAIALRDSFFNWSMALFTMIAISSMVFSYDIGYSLLALSRWLKALIMVYLIVQLVRSAQDFDLLAVTVFGAMLASVFLGFANMLAGNTSDSSYMGEVRMFRFSALHDNANNAALYMLSTVPIGIYLIKRYHRVWQRVGIALGILCLLIGVVATFSRQAVFPFAFIAAATMFREARRKRTWVLIGIGVVLVSLLSPRYYWQRLMSVGDIFANYTQDWSFFLRVTAMKMAMKLIAENPITGVGLGNFIVRSGSELFVRLVAHNTYLEVLSGVGIFGFIAYLSMFAASMRSFMRAIRTRWAGENRYLGDFAYYMMVSFVATVIGATFASIPFYYCIWVPLAAGLALGVKSMRVPVSSP